MQKDFCIFDIFFSLIYNVCVPGNYSERATPVPIPNTAVKPFSADGTVGATLRESRTLPGTLSKYYLEFRASESELEQEENYLNALNFPQAKV